MKVGVIGTGKMGENHVKTYLELKDYCQLVGIFDDDKDRGLEIAQKYNVNQFLTIDELLKNVDAVSIAVPTEFHYNIGLQCIRHKTHMLMEKPITATVDEANDLIQKANQAGVNLQVGHIELFNPLIQLLKKELENKNIIGISFLRMNPYDDRLKNVDVVEDLMIHDLYILAELLQDRFVDFHAAGSIIGSTTKHAAAIIKSFQGVVAKLMASFKSKRRIRKIQVLTEDAFIEADLVNSTLTMSQETRLNNGFTIPLKKTIIIDQEIKPLYFQLNDFLDCIKRKNPPSVTGEDGKQTLELAMKISQLIQS